MIIKISIIFLKFIWFLIKKAVISAILSLFCLLTTEDSNFSILIFGIFLFFLICLEIKYYANWKNYFVTQMGKHKTLEEVIKKTNEAKDKGVVYIFFKNLEEKIFK